MKKFFYFYSLLLTAFLWLGSGTMWGATLTVADGSATNTGVPICGNYADTKGMRSQFIYPSSLLTDMEYGAISKVKFYSSTVSKAFTSTFEVRLSEISASTLSGFNTDGGTKVYTGSLTIADNEMEITFDTPYEYNGDGNLLFDIEVTANTSAWVNAAFYGITQSGAGYSNKVNYGGAQVCNLLPKATFSYTPGTPPTCPKPKNLNLTDLSSASASFGWTKGASETSWQYVCLPAATAVDWSDAAVKIANTTPAATVTGLTAETSYKFYVRAYCGSSDQSTELVKAFKTPCAGESLPWDCGFETSEGYSTGSYSSAAPTCWDMLNANQGAYPYIYISTSYAKSGNGLYFQSSKSKYGYIILPPFEHGLDVLKLSFSHKEEGTSSTAGQITVGYMTDPADEESFVPVRVCTRVTSHTTVSDILFTGAPSYGRIAFRYGGGTGDQWYAGIDDIHVEATMDCGKPATPTYSDLTGSSVTISWAANAGVTDYKYINVDRTANPTYVLDWTNDATAVTGTSVDLTTLTSGHNYEFYVMCACGTVASDACAFTPSSCPAIESESITLSDKLYNSVTVNWSSSVNCDVRYSTDGGENWSAPIEDISDAYKAIEVSVGNTYTFAVKPHCNNAEEAWVVCAETYEPQYPVPGVPAISDITDNAASAEWTIATGASGYQYIAVASGEPNWTDATSTTSLSGNAISGLGAGTDYTLYVRAKFGENNYGAANSNTFSTITLAPAFTSAAPSTGETTATLALESYTGSATQFQYVVMPGSKAANWTGATIVAKTTSIALSTGLSAGNSYTLYVRAYYGESVQSSAVSKAFTTDCPDSYAVSETVAWTQDFEAQLVDAVPACWESPTTNDSWEYAKVVSTYGKNSTQCLDVKVNGTATKIIELPVFNEKAKYLKISFDYNNGSTSSNYGPLEVGYYSSGTFTNVATLDRVDSYSASGVIEMPSNAPVNARVAFRVVGVKSGSNSHSYIDNISVLKKPSCPVPTDLAAEVTFDGADVTWTAGGEETEWSLRYSVKDANSWTTVNDIDATNYTITGLSTANIYEVQVQANCGSAQSSWTASAQFQPECLAPSDLHTTALAHNAATIAWTRNAKELRYKTGSNEWTVETITPAATSFNLSDLNEQTTYTVQVKAACEDGDNWSDEFDFTTKCEPTTIVKGTPFEEGFSSWPSCWEKSAGSYPSASGTLRFYGKTGDSYQEVVFPGFTNDIEDLTLSFEHKNTYSGTTYGGTLQIGYIKTDGTFVNRATLTPGASYATYENVITKADAEDAVANYAIRYTASYDYASVYIDNVKVFVSPTCYTPASLSDAASITSEGATFTWTASGHGETQYQYCIDEDWSNAIITSALTATVTGLNPSTNYTFYVRSYCDEEDQSEAISKPLPTGCGTIANAELPWSYGFEGIANYGEPQCWTLIPASYYSAYVTSSNYHEGSRAMYVTAGKADVNRSVVVLPEFDMPLKKFNVSFFYKGSNGTIAVGYVTNPADKSTFVQVGEAVTVGSSYQEATIPFTALGDVTGNIAFRFKGNTGDGSFYIDDIRVAKTHVLSDAVDNSSVLADNVGQTVDVTIGRTFVCADYYNTICLPFDLSAEQLAASPIASNDLWAFKYARVEGGELLIRIIETDHINAGEPYLIAFPAGDPIVNPLFKNVTISASSGKTMGEENLKFVGTLKPETFAAHDDSKLFLYQNNTLYWWDGDAPSSLKSFRAFFTVEGGADSMPIKRLPARLIKHEETTTGVGAVQNGNVHCTKVLENNQVVIIRNGVKYSIQGQKVQ